MLLRNIEIIDDTIVDNIRDVTAEFNIDVTNDDVIDAFALALLLVRRPDRFTRFRTDDQTRMGVIRLINCRWRWFTPTGIPKLACSEEKREYDGD
jgi:hypothetical protein